MRSPSIRGAGTAWYRFWFAPEPTSTLAIFRIVFGALVFFWTLALVPDLDAFFARNGVDPTDTTNLANGWWGFLQVFDSHVAVVAVCAVLMLAALCLMVGFHARLASVVVFVGVLSFEQRAPSVFNSGDGLLRTLAFFLMFAPSGASLSVDRWRHAPDAFWAFPARSPWALRLIQIQVSVMYLASVWEKLQGSDWRNGTAVSYALGLRDFQRFSPPGTLVHSLLVSSVMSYTTLATELMVGVLVWNRAARPLVLALGVCLHVSIALSIRVGFFSETVLTAYLAFLSPAAATAGLLAIRRRWAGRTGVAATDASDARRVGLRALVARRGKGSEPALR
jgi:hypothetical protein